jgi:hypothetical protein
MTQYIACSVSEFCRQIDHHSRMEWMDGVAGHRTGKFNEPGKQLTSEVRTVRSSLAARLTISDPTGKQEQW